MLADRGDQQRLVDVAQRSGLLRLRIQRREERVDSRSEPGEILDQAQVLGVELASSVMCDHPHRADHFSLEVERRQKRLFYRRQYRNQIGVV